MHNLINKLLRTIHHKELSSSNLTISVIDTPNRISSIQRSQQNPLALSEQLNKTFLINRLLPQV